eukprot:TRINITY_DN21824_c0_g1_i1.p1 TRINITY_DN21824_c0_g1~~TRINITY_DN21824_c0_g1_i1.p1  ORF type:complete len:143 (-),score=47.07 TRINITY_DN21824_c0_g1_i1:86-514(-)
MMTACSSCMFSRQLATSTIFRVKLTTVSRQEEDSGPVKFTRSKAYNLNPLMSNQQKKKDTPWFQGPLVAGSTLAFLIYFTILREESDVDGELAGRLYDRIEGLEKQDLINSIKFNEENGMDTTALRARLKEVIEEEEKSRAA